MTEPLLIEFEDGSTLKFVHKPGGFVMLEARGALGPTVTAMEISPAEAQQIRDWLNKHDVAKRAETAKEATARRGHDGG